MSRHSSTEQLMRWLDTSHLPEHLQRVSVPCADLATKVSDELSEDSPELTAGLRKLLEAKDCFVRAAIAHHESNGEQQ